MANITDFLALVRTRGLSLKHKYAVNILGPNINRGAEKDISLLCEDASIPGYVIGTRTVRLNNLNVRRPSTIDYMGKSSTFTFLIDNPWTARGYFDTWIDKIFSNSREVNQYIDIIGTIEVIAVAETGYTKTNREPKELYGVVLEEAFPTGVSLMPVAYNSIDVHRMTIEFAFKRWKKKQTPTDSPEMATPQGPGLPSIPSNIPVPSLSRLRPPSLPRLPQVPKPPTYNALVDSIRRRAGLP